MGLFGKKNQSAEQEHRRQQATEIAERCKEQVSNFPGMEWNGANYRAADLQLDISRMIGASLLMGDETILWYAVKVSALIRDSGESLPVRDIAKNLIWCKLTASGLIEKYRKQIPTLEILNRIDQAWIRSMESGSKYTEATELIAQEHDKLLMELQQT